MQSLSISIEQARRFLINYHFIPTDLPSVFEHLGTVQYDPLNPVGRNADLVLQARIPDYRVDDWQKAAYTDRLIYDAWDKQACLVPTSDWSMREQTRAYHRPYHDREILQADPLATEMVLSALDARGPLSSLEFEDRQLMSDQNSWYGLTRTKRVLRALWSCGIIVTHHRQAGRHYYDRPERVIPAHHYNLPPFEEKEEYYRWIIARRYQATGLLRPNAEACIWSACGDTAMRKTATAELVEAGRLTPVLVGEKRWPYSMPTSAIPLLDAAPLKPRIIFLGPLDNLLWDRKAVQQLFNFDYLWEVYKPLPKRRWGYYVLPVLYGDCFIARVDSRLIGKNWTIFQWWWEPDLIIDADLLANLKIALQNFLVYLGADNLCFADSYQEPILATIVESGFHR